MSSLCFVLYLVPLLMVKSKKSEHSYVNLIVECA